MKSATQLFHAISQRVLELSKPFKIALALLLLFLILVLIFPFEIKTVPAWNLKLVDDANRPVEGIHVTEHWQHYLLEADGHEEIKISDRDGRVSFSEHSIRASLLHRLFAHVGKFNATGQAARIDPYASVVAWGSKDHETTAAVLKLPESPPSVLVVRSR